VGAVSFILAKELLHHLSREHRDRIHVAAEAEHLFYQKRLIVLRELNTPMEHANTGAHRRRILEERDSITHRVQVAQGEDTNEMGVYSVEGRLRTIGKVLRQDVHLCATWLSCRWKACLCVAQSRRSESSP